jgi:hypothetical protein
LLVIQDEINEKASDFLTEGGAQIRKSMGSFRYHKSTKFLKYANPQIANPHISTKLCTTQNSYKSRRFK